MDDKKQIAVFLNYSKAQLYANTEGRVHLLEEVISPYKRIKRVAGESDHKTKFGASPQFASNNEHNQNNIAQNELYSFVKSLEKKLLAFDNILIFGSGKAKEYLKNHLETHKQFKLKNISLLNTDKLTENQKIAFVRNHWNQKVS